MVRAGRNDWEGRLPVGLRGCVVGVGVGVGVRRDRLPSAGAATATDASSM